MEAENKNKTENFKEKLGRSNTNLINGFYEVLLNDISKIVIFHSGTCAEKTFRAELIVMKLFRG